jgi:DNA-binding NarL/FixJ family response regulator
MVYAVQNGGHLCLRLLCVKLLAGLSNSIYVSLRRITKFYLSCFNQGIILAHRKHTKLVFSESEFDMLDRFAEGVAGSSPNIATGHMSTVRRQLAIVDQSRLRCDCLKLALAHQPRRWHVTDVASAAELAQLVQRGEEYDVILLGGSTCAHVDLVDIAVLAAAAPHTPILVAAECDDPSRAHAILRAGAKGFLPTSHSLKVLMGALERVRAGGTYVPLALTEPVPAATAERAQRTPWRELTRRQRDVLALISEGKSNKLIADALHMSESTVKAHVKQIIRRLNVANRTQAALLATRAIAAH